MTTLNETIQSGFSAHYQLLGSKVLELAQPLTDEQFWRKPFPYGNSFAHLVLHLTGNLNYYIGAEIAETGYVRNRDREFSESARPSKDEVLKQFGEVIALVARSARAQSETDWSLPYTAMREETAGNRFNIFLCKPPPPPPWTDDLSAVRTFAKVVSLRKSGEELPLQLLATQPIWDQSRQSDRRPLAQ